MTYYWASIAVLGLLGALLEINQRRRHRDAEHMAAVEEILALHRPRERRRDPHGRFKRTYGHFPVKNSMYEKHD
jgi:hypothetical protein